MTDDQHQGVIGAITDLGSRMVSVLPPAFIALLVINTIFIGVVFWHLDHQSDARLEVINKIIDHCLAK